jgi:hypothetical protein
MENGFQPVGCVVTGKAPVCQGRRYARPAAAGFAGMSAFQLDVFLLANFFSSR